MGIKIFVDTQEEKDQLLEASAHLHYTDANMTLPGIMTMSYLHFNPELIVVQNKYGKAPPIQAKPLSE